ncbi:MAG: lysophospholipid acyltransferase family protein [Phycisphaerales bacterium JB039]
MRAPAWTQRPIAAAIRAVVAGAGSAPAWATLRAARGLGRLAATAPANRKRLERAEGNLRVAFPDWDDDRVRRTAIATYEHLFMLGAEIAHGPRALTPDAWLRHVRIGEVAAGVREVLAGRPAILITGHCGNWEVLGCTVAMLGFPLHALYRPLDLAPLDDWVRRTRRRYGLTLVDKFGAVHQLPQIVRRGAPVAFVADQNGGDRGVFVPFFNRLTSSYKSIGLLAMQFDASIICGLARRDAPMGAAPDGLRYRFDVIDVYGPADWSGQPDPLFYLTARYRRAIETMIRLAPEQYLWMHRIWRSRPRHERLGRPFPDQMAEKIRSLPWTTEADLERIMRHSEQDAATLARLGTSRLS